LKKWRRKPSQWIQETLSVCPKCLALEIDCFVVLSLVSTSFHFNPYTEHMIRRFWLVALCALGLTGCLSSIQSVTISPKPSSLLTGATQQFGATVVGAGNTQVQWSATGGSISSSGLFTAPTTVGNVTITAQSLEDSSKSDSVLLQITSSVASGNSTLRGNLFFDANKNGIKEATEKPRSGFVVWIDSNNNGSFDAGERKTTTDSSGNYSLANLTAGTYNLRHELPVGYASSLALSGSRLSQQIVGGTNAPTGKWNSIVALLLSNRPDPFKAQSCGGNLIAPNWILTAAHCVVEQGVVALPSSLQIAIGFTRLENPLARVNISQIIVHPNYIEQTFDNDIALLKLSSQLDNPTLRPVLPSETALTADGVSASIVGWGGLNPQLVKNNNIEQNYATDLQEASVPIGGCGQVTAQVTVNMFCAGGQNIDTCQGDSGGPIYVFDQGSLRQAGIVSWGAGCAQTGYPGVYTKLTNFDAWLAQQIGRGTPPSQSIVLAAGETKTQNFAVRTQ
jgi:hypothetical protein